MGFDIRGRTQELVPSTQQEYTYIPHEITVGVLQIEACGYASFIKFRCIFFSIG